MYKVLVLALLAITLTTGFTCSKNETASQTPAVEATTAEAQGSMTTEATTAEGAPAEAPATQEEGTQNQ